MNITVSNLVKDLKVFLQAANCIRRLFTNDGSIDKNTLYIMSMDGNNALNLKSVTLVI